MRKWFIGLAVVAGLFLLGLMVVEFRPILLSWLPTFSVNDWHIWLGLGILLVAGLMLYILVASVRMGDTCPRCHGPLERVHRTWFDRLLTITVLPNALRYRCTNPMCSWRGLRNRRHGEHSHRRQPADTVD
jgi:hypothetical protein